MGSPIVYMLIFFFLVMKLSWPVIRQNTARQKTKLNAGGTKAERVGEMAWSQQRGKT